MSKEKKGKKIEEKPSILRIKENFINSICEIETFLCKTKKVSQACQIRCIINECISTKKH